MTDLEQSLRDSLRGRAGAVDVGPDPLARVAAAVRDDRRGRRQAAVGGVSLALVLAVGGGAYVADRARTPSAPASSTVTVDAPGRPAAGAITTWSPRGDLVWDQAFREAIRGIVPTAAPVVFAGRVGDQRVVVTRHPAGEPSSPRRPDPEVLKAWIFPADVPLDRLGGRMSVVEGPAGEDSFVTIALGPGRGSRLLVLTTSNLSQAEVSDEPDYAPDGTVRARWRTVPLRNGVGTTTIRSATWEGVRTRALGYGGGVSVAPSLPGDTGVVSDGTSVVGPYVSRILRRHGWTEADVQVEARQVALPTGGGPGQGLVLLVRHQGGPTVLDWHLQLGSGDTGSTLDAPAPRVVPQDTAGLQPSLVPTDVDGPDYRRTRRGVVLLPRTEGPVARLRLHAGAVGVSPVLADVPVRDGVAAYSLDRVVDLRGTTAQLQLLGVSGRVVWAGPAAPPYTQLDDLGVPVYGERG